MKIIVHRGAHEVGGSCVEIVYGTSSILVDAGLPLDFNANDAEIESCFPQPLFSLLRQHKKSFDGVLLSHPHLDHYGLAGQIPDHVPVYCGKATWSLMNATARFSPNKTPLPKVEYFEALREFQIGEFKVTPYLMDHSAFDAYGFLIGGGGKNIFYSGDFRSHGRKSALIDRLLNQLPEIDMLITEGTLIGDRSGERHRSEFILEDEFTRILEETQGIVLITTSSQNIDRLVTIFKATRRSGRMFIIDFYTAEVLDILKECARLPNADWPMIRVCYPSLLARQFRKDGLNDVLERHRENGIKWTRINEKRANLVMLVRPGFIPDMERFIDLNGATWIYSLWSKYMERSKSLKKLKGFFESHGVRYEYIHTSGHASLDDLIAFVEKLNPKKIVPVHTYHPHQFRDHFVNVRVVEDGEVVVV